MSASENVIRKQMLAIPRGHSTKYTISTQTFPPIEHKWTIDSWEAEDEAGEYLSINRDQAYGISKTHRIIHLQPSQTEPLISEERKKDELKLYTQEEVPLGFAN